jgi:hypothetical protein
VKAAFTDKLPVAGILGRRGFFENFKVTFDYSYDPPEVHLERIHRA